MTYEPSARVVLGGVHAYAEKSVRAGDLIRFRISSEHRYTLEVVRLGRDPDGPALDETLRRFRGSRPRQQPIYPGSYVRIVKPLPARRALHGLTLECWVRLQSPAAWQGLITQHTFPDRCGFGLFIDPAGHVVFYLGNGGAFAPDGLKTGPPLAPQQWYHIAGVWDGQRATLWVDGEEAAGWPFSGIVRPGTAPLRLAAYGQNGQTTQFLDGDLAMAIIYDRPLTPAQVRDRYAGQGLILPPLRHVLGCWPFDEERGDHVADVSRHRRHGRIVNHATWMIGGPSFDASAVPRFGHYDPAADPRRGHALRFASDDLYDCGWKVRRTYRIPRDARPGIYVGRVRYGAGHFYDVPFIIRRGPRRKKAPIVVLCSTNTWLAYNSTPFAANHTDPDPRRYWGTGGGTNLAGAPAYSLYRDHIRSQPTYYVGVNVPWPAAGPYILYSDLTVNYSHLMRAERFAQRWLEDSGYDCDVITDFDLHRDPDALSGYTVLMINGHSEYWSAPAYEAVDRFLRKGGNVLALSGNTMFWRVSFDEGLRVMECRKLPMNSAGGRTNSAGEIYHSDDGRRGGLMRECGYPAWSVLGMEAAGWLGTAAGNFDVYRCEHPEHFLFTDPEPVGLALGDTFGGPAAGGLPRAVGHEWDIRISRIAGAPPGEPAGIESLATCSRPTWVWDYACSPQTTGEPTISEVIYWERPMGGRIFCIGSIGAGWGLSSDARMQTLLHNVLRHFGVSPGS